MEINNTRVDRENKRVMAEMRQHHSGREDARTDRGFRDIGGSVTCIPPRQHRWLRAAYTNRDAKRTDRIARSLPVFIAGSSQH